MDVLIALCARPVPDRDPGGGGEGLAFETQRHHETTWRSLPTPRR